MNIAFFLLPKKDVVCLNVNSTMRQALEKMENHGYTAVPLIDDKGKYIGTITEGDFLWKLKHSPELNFNELHKVPLREVPLKREHQPVSVNAEMESLVSLVLEQNFVPVVDDQGIFIGIVRRRDIIDYSYSHLLKQEQ